MKTKLFVSVLLILGFVYSTSAQTRRIVQNQNKRIEQGVRNGEITRGERARIGLQKSEVRQEVRDAKEDGVVTNSEKMEIVREKRKLDGLIFRTKHNANTRK